jgi:hypothetical protein
MDARASSAPFFQVKWINTSQNNPKPRPDEESC